MKIKVRLAEPFWRHAGIREQELELASGALVCDAIAVLAEKYPALEKEFAEAPPIVFVGDEEAGFGDLLLEGQRIHLVWPVAGG